MTRHVRRTPFGTIVENDTQASIPVLSVGSSQEPTEVNGQISGVLIRPAIITSQPRTPIEDILPTVSERTANVLKDITEEIRSSNQTIDVDKWRTDRNNKPQEPKNTI